MKIRLVILFLIVSLTGFNQNDFPYGKISVKNFNRDEYAATPQNWDVIQDKDHFLYFANNGGILEFNGETWAKLEMDNREHPRSFASSDSGKIYVGGRGEFGFIDKDNFGKSVYKKLSGSVDSLDFSDIWQVYCIDEHTYFVSGNYVFIHYQDKVEAISVPEGQRIKRSVCYKETLICTFEKETGDESYLLRGNKYLPINNSVGFTPVTLFAEGNNLLVIDDRGNFHEFQQNGNAYQFVKLLDRKLDIGEGFKINDIRIKNELIVVGTAGNGVFIFNLRGKLIRSFMEREGLENLEIKRVYFDQYNNIWLCNDNGISFLETSGAITAFDKNYGITGTTEDIYMRGDQIFLATHTDLYQSVYNPGHLQFEKRNVFGMETFQIKEFTFSDGKTYTLVIANDGVYYLDENLKKTLIDDIYAWDLSQSKLNPNILYVGMDGDGVGSIRYEAGQFQYLGLFKNTSGEVRSVIEHDGKVYYSVKYDGIHIMDTTREQQANRLTGIVSYPTSDYQQFTMAEFQGQIYVGTSNGLYVINNDKLEQCSLINGRFAEEKLLVHRVINDYEEKLWLVLYHNSETPEEYSEIGYLEKKDGEFVWVSSPFRQMHDDIIHIIKRGKDGIYWFGGGSKVYAYNVNHKANFDQPYQASITKVSLNEDSVFVYNTKYAKLTDPSITYSFNSVRFDFSSTAYLGGIENQYSYYLEGFETEWGKWKETSYAEYQRLGEGQYVFHVKAKNYYGYESEEVTFAFTILPPWYRTIWAYIIYFILFVLLIYIVIRLAIHRVKQQKEELEKIVQERTHEIAEQNHLLEHQKAEIEEKTNDILDSIKYAKRIQNTILPGEDKLSHIFNHEHFVLYKPKDIVSGDFYWAARFENKTIFSAIDCTGHGVPGAFVSIVGFNGLNRTVNEFKLRQPAAILDKLTELVVDTFSQSESNIKDGMDIGLCAIDNNTLILEFSGANNPCVVIRNKEAIELKPDKQPIGEFDNRQPFTNHEFQLQKGDCVYVFSDGYADQFGGPKGKKLKYKALRDLLIEISEMDMKTQLKRLDDAFMSWKGDYEQLDDVCLFGVRIK